jgi:hypothetical protein
MRLQPFHFQPNDLGLPEGAVAPEITGDEITSGFLWKHQKNFISLI